MKIHSLPHSSVSASAPVTREVQKEPRPPWLEPISGNLVDLGLEGGSRSLRPHPEPCAHLTSPRGPGWGWEAEVIAPGHLLGGGGEEQKAPKGEGKDGQRLEAKSWVPGEAGQQWPLGQGTWPLSGVTHLILHLSLGCGYPNGFGLFFSHGSGYWVQPGLGREP